MNREQNLLDAILSDSKKNCEKIEKEAKKEAKKIFDDAKQKEKQFFEQEIAVFLSEQEKQLQNFKMLSFCEKEEQVLQCKNEILGQVKNLALQKLKDLRLEDYKNFLKNVLNQAEDFDEVVVASKKDKQIVESFAVFKRKKLKVKSNLGDFCGGLLLVSKKFEKDFSFESLVNQKFEQSQLEIAKSLF